MPWTTHRVFNVAPDLADYNLYQRDLALREAVQRHCSRARDEALSRYGATLGRQETLQAADDANRHPPELRTHDPQGHRIDSIHYHPGWHHMMRLLREQGLVSQPFSDSEPGAWSAYAAGFSMHGQIEAGSQCPASMTFASIALLREEPELFADLRPGLYSRTYDARDVPIPGKGSLLIGMGMTEKQGGSDVRSNQTVATPIAAAGRGQAYALTGHKWFFSAPASDAHLVVAREGAERISCFYVPRFLPDGSRNAIRIQRLKDKLGNRSNASGEVEFQDAWGILIGEEGQGIRTIIRMAAHTRLNCVMGSTGLMRQALSQAIHHCRHRQAFGGALVDKPLMRNVLADLALESEAATLLMMRLAQAFEHSDDNRLDQAYARIMTPAAKLWLCKRAIAYCAEAMETLGGNGYVEECVMPRLLRETPVNSIWEGSGNIMALDVLRAIQREPEAAGRLLPDLQQLCASDTQLTDKFQWLQQALRSTQQEQECNARRIASLLVLLAQALLMRRYAPQASADAFIASRFPGESPGIAGTLPSGLALEAIIERAWPV